MIPELTNIMDPAAKMDPREVAAKVQSMFMEVMLKAMEESVDAEDGLFGKSLSSDMYRGMLREHLSKAMSQQTQGPLEAILSDALSQPVSPNEPNTGGRRPPRAEGLPVSGLISSGPGWRRDPIDGSYRYHAGMDIAAPVGTPIYAVAGGRVVESGLKGGYGNAVVIETEDGRKMLYAHNKRNLVQVGDWVSRGDAIAEVGVTGRTTGSHVHFEVKF